MLQISHAGHKHYCSVICSIFAMRKCVHKGIPRFLYISLFSFSFLFSFVEADFVPRSLLLTSFAFNPVDFKVLSRFFALVRNFKTSFLRSLLILLKTTANMKMPLSQTVPYYDK